MAGPRDEDAGATQPMPEPVVPVFDGHNDTILRLELAARAGEPLNFAAGVTPGSNISGKGPRLAIDLPRARTGGFAGGLFALFTPSPRAIAAAGAPRGAKPKKAPDDSIADVTGPADAVPQPTALAFTTAMLARLRQLARALPQDVAIVSTGREARAAMAEGRIAALPHIEGAECIDTDLAALDVLHAAGVRSLGPVWSRTNAFGHGAPMVPQPELEPGEGLTDAGRALVAACEVMGIMIDCAHLTEKGFWDVAAATDQPLVVSHSNAHAVCPSARNLTDRQLDAVAERGGLVGLNFHVAFLRPDCRHDPNTDLDVLLRHLDHMLERLGERGVALGSDFDGCLLPKAIGDVTGLQALVSAMRAAGYGEALIARIARQNWLEMIERVVPD